MADGHSRACRLEPITPSTVTWRSEVAGNASLLLAPTSRALSVHRSTSTWLSASYGGRSRSMRRSRPPIESFEPWPQITRRSEEAVAVGELDGFAPTRRLVDDLVARQPAQSVLSGHLRLCTAPLSAQAVTSLLRRQAPLSLMSTWSEDSDSRRSTKAPEDHRPRSRASVASNPPGASLRSVDAPRRVRPQARDQTEAEDRILVSPPR